MSGDVRAQPNEITQIITPDSSCASSFPNLRYVISLCSVQSVETHSLRDLEEKEHLAVPQPQIDPSILWVSINHLHNIHTYCNGQVSTYYILIYYEHHETQAL